jgi:hypothetical protein
MSKTFIPNGQSTEYQVSGNYGDYELASGATMTKTSGDSLTVATDAYGNRITINGTMQADTGSTTGIYDDGNDTRFFVGTDGKIFAGHSGIYFSGDGGSVNNAGTITGDYAVNIGGNGVTVVNSGTLDGDSSGVTSGRNATVINKAGGEIHGDLYGIALGFSGGQNVIRNFGSVTSDDFAIRGSTGVDRVVNHGTVDGKISLYQGDDVFDGRGGNYDGAVEGGLGDDVYWLGDTDTTITEGVGGGYDRVRAGFSFHLADNTEEGWLTGSKNLKLFGTANGDVLYGNTGANVISGNAGADFLTGGRGNDKLFGGSASGGPDASGDVFIFKAHSGDDVIADFEDGTDHINLASYTGIDDFADLKGKIQQVGDDCVIGLLNGDSIRIDDTLKSAIKVDDFQF